MAWRVYYDGEVQDSARGLEGMPCYGVLVILQQRSNDQRWYITSNAPYYLWDGNEWLPAYENDLVDYMVHQPDKIQKLIVGRIVNKARFVEVYEQAKADREKALDNNLG